MARVSFTAALLAAMLVAFGPAAADVPRINQGDRVEVYIDPESDFDAELHVFKETTEYKWHCVLEWDFPWSSGAGLAEYVADTFIDGAKDGGVGADAFLIAGHDATDFLTEGKDYLGLTIACGRLEVLDKCDIMKKALGITCDTKTYVLRDNAVAYKIYRTSPEFCVAYVVAAQCDGNVYIIMFGGDHKEHVRVVLCPHGPNDAAYRFVEHRYVPQPLRDALVELDRKVAEEMPVWPIVALAPLMVRRRA